MLTTALLLGGAALSGGVVVASTGEAALPAAALTVVQLGGAAATLSRWPLARTGVTIALALQVTALLAVALVLAVATLPIGGPAEERPFDRGLFGATWGVVIAVLALHVMAYRSSSQREVLVMTQIGDDK